MIDLVCDPSCRNHGTVTESLGDSPNESFSKQGMSVDFHLRLSLQTSD